MATQLEICNLALSWIGAKKIYDLAEDSVEAQLCATNYPLSRDALLEARMWTFATKQIVPARPAGTPPAPWANQFAIPSDCLRVFRVVDGDMNRVPWIRQGQLILCDSTAINMSYVARLTDTSVFSAAFVHAIAARMAADIAVTYTENRSLQADLWAAAEKKLKEAAATDGSQGRSDQINRPPSYLSAKRYS